MNSFYSTTPQLQNHLTPICATFPSAKHPTCWLSGGSGLCCGFFCGCLRIFAIFWRCWKPWKMQPFSCENTILEHLRARTREPYFYQFHTNLECLWSFILDHLDWLFCVDVFHHKFIKRFLFVSSWAGGTWGTSQKRGELLFIRQIGSHFAYHYFLSFVCSLNP